MSYTYFSQEDFDKCNPPCRLEDMNPDTLSRFDMARGYSDTSYVVTSAARSLAHERSRGRDGTSSHLFTLTKKAYAMDIRFKTNNQLMKIVAGGIKAGFRRIGINWKKKFVHMDDDPNKPESLWPY